MNHVEQYFDQWANLRAKFKKNVRIFTGHQWLHKHSDMIFGNIQLSELILG